MAHSRPSDIDNVGDAERITHAAGRFVIELAADRRVQAFQHVWLAARPAAQQKLDQAIARAKALGRREELIAEVTKAAINTFEDGLHGAVQQFVRDELHLKPVWIPWVAECLIDVFQISAYNAQHPDAPKEFSVPVFLKRDAPQGRLPRQAGLDIERNVRWFYLANVFAKPASIHDLARDYQSSLPAARAGDSRSVVQNGIKQAEALLDLVAKRAVRLPPGK